MGSFRLVDVVKMRKLFLKKYKKSSFDYPEEFERFKRKKLGI